MFILSPGSFSSACLSHRQTTLGHVARTRPTTRQNHNGNLPKNLAAPKTTQLLPAPAIRKTKLPIPIAPATTATADATARVAARCAIPALLLRPTSHPRYPPQSSIFRCKNRLSTLPNTCPKPFTYLYGSHPKLAPDTASARRVPFRFWILDFGLLPATGVAIKRSGFQCSILNCRLFVQTRN